MIKLCVHYKNYLVECQNTLKEVFNTLENVPDGVWLVDSPKGLIITENPIDDNFFMVYHCPCFDEDDCDWCT